MKFKGRVIGSKLEHQEGVHPGLKIELEFHDTKTHTIFESTIEIPFTKAAARAYFVGRELTVQVEPK